jgi:hypothetical protein
MKKMLIKYVVKNYGLQMLKTHLKYSLCTSPDVRKVTVLVFKALNFTALQQIFPYEILT